MFLPFNENAIIHHNKIINYLLLETHAIGKTKSKFFRKIGFNENNLDEFKYQLLKFKELEIFELNENKYGTKYIINGEITSPNSRKYKLTTIWVLENGSKIPYLVTSYPF